MPRWFGGGVVPDEKKKNTEHKLIEALPPPERIILPMSMHIGAPCEPVVSPGNMVAVGQIVADSDAPVSAPIHATVSGMVEGVELYPHPNGKKELAIIINNDGKDRLDPSVRPHGSMESLSSDQLLSIIRNAGIVGLGGAAFPTHFKIQSAQGRCDTVIINGCECEPYITSDHRLMLEAPEEVIGGLRIIMKLLSPKRAVIAVESNKKDAHEALRRTLPGKTDIELKMLRTRYPQGSEKQLIRSITGREVPAGKLPADVGCAVFNVDTAAAVHRAVTTGLPLIRRIVTVSGGAVSNPKNLSVRIGTPIGEIFAATGGFREAPSKILTGGPMMGGAQYDLSVPLIKGCGSLLAFSAADMPPAGSEICIRCGKCVAVCPMRLLPNYLYLYERKDRLDQLKKLHLQDCIECGSCSYICPGRLYLVHSFRTGKQKLLDQKKKQEETNVG